MSHDILDHPTRPGGAGGDHRNDSAGGSSGAQHAPEGGAKHNGTRIAWTVIIGVILAAVALMGGLRAEGEVGHGAAIPDSAESAVASARAAGLPGGDSAPLLVVASRADAAALTPDDSAAIDAAGTRVADSLSAHGIQTPPIPPLPSEDGKATVLTFPVPSSTVEDSDAAKAVVDDARAAAADSLPGDLQVQTTGGSAFGVDIAGAFAGANFLLLGVTIAIVAILLLITYRSPLLMLIPLLVVALADRVAATVTGFAGIEFGFGFDAGIISVLVFGAGTNYALLMISRYREELGREAVARAGADSHEVEMSKYWHLEPLGRAFRATAPAIAASNITVVLALLSLLATVVPATRGIGIAAAIGLLLTLAVVLPLLPAVLAVSGPKVFWPRNPQKHVESARRLERHDGVWAKVASAVTRRPAQVVAGGVVVLAIASMGILGSGFGLSQTEQFRGDTESAAGLEVVADHYPAGMATPLTIVADSSSASAVSDAVSAVPGVTRVSEGTPGADGRVSISVTGNAAPSSPEAFEQVQGVRDAAHAADPGAVVGGQDAEALDAKDSAIRDLKVALPIILAVVGIVVGFLLRSAILAAIIVLVDVLGSAAALGLGTLLGREVFGFPAIDTNVPLLALLFLVALGVDYSLFLAHRIRLEVAAGENAERASGHDGALRAVSRGLSATGGVITSAGVVLAAVFAALGVLPLVTLLQIGVVVCIGVLLDTLLVRTVLMPAIFAMLPRSVWTK
ncbi:MMPL family transporter [Dietzia sp.]|uniref:MMPL family transporter n=1 Tax=Dietzia sp. TaxID=1871616 RepID=UPI002FD9A24F